MLELESSASFAATHAAVEKLRQVAAWTAAERELLFAAALANSQVRYILADPDVKAFFSGLLADAAPLTKAAREVQAAVEKT